MPDRLTSRAEPAPPAFELAHDLPPRSRVLAGVTALLIVLAASILLAVFLVAALRQDQSQLHDRNVPYASAVAEASLWAKAIANDERGYLLTGDRTFIEQIDQRVGFARSAFAEAERAADGVEQIQTLDEAVAGFEEWHARLRSQIALFQAGERERAKEAALGPGRELRHDYEAKLAEAQLLADRTVATTSRSLASASERMVAILLALLVVALAVGFAVAAWLMHSIVRPAYTLLGRFGDPGRASPLR